MFLQASCLSKATLFWLDQITYYFILFYQTILSETGSDCPDFLLHNIYKCGCNAIIYVGSNEIFTTQLPLGV